MVRYPRESSNWRQVVVEARRQPLDLGVPIQSKVVSSSPSADFGCGPDECSRHIRYILEADIHKDLSPRAYSSAIIEPSEIIEKIPPEGIKIAELIQKFSGRVGDGPGMMKKQDWIKLVKEQCEYGPDRRLHRKKEGGS